MRCQAAHVALFYLLKALSKRQSKPRLQMFNEVLLGRVEPSYWIAVEVLAQVSSAAQPTHRSNSQGNRPVNMQLTRSQMY